MSNYLARGVIARHRGAPVELVDIVIPDPGPDDVVVRILACGVCHTDVLYQQGSISQDYPFLLGHEAAGIVERVGNDVSEVVPGDFVILNWRAVCGQCRACRRGKPQYCFQTFNASRPMMLVDGTSLTAALGIGAFATHTLVHAGQCTKVSAQADPSAACLLGCGVMAGLGAALYTAELHCEDTLAVIGCGGVGCGAIAGASLVGAQQIIAVDPSEDRLSLARQFGATHVINPTQCDTVQTIRSLTSGFGADVVIDAVGKVETFTQAFYGRDLAGQTILVGVPSPTERLDLALSDLFSHGGSIKPSWYGDCLPQRDFPTMINLYLQGRFPLDRFVSQRIRLSDVGQALEEIHVAEGLRSVVIPDFD